MARPFAGTSRHNIFNALIHRRHYNCIRCSACLIMFPTENRRHALSDNSPLVEIIAGPDTGGRTSGATEPIV